MRYVTYVFVEFAHIRVFEEKLPLHVCCRTKGKTRKVKMAWSLFYSTHISFSINTDSTRSFVQQFICVLNVLLKTISKCWKKNELIIANYSLHWFYSVKCIKMMIQATIKSPEYSKSRRICAFSMSRIQYFSVFI